MTTNTYLIRWNTGYGDDYDVVHTKDLESAFDWAYDEWKEAFENQADYDAVLATRENLEDAGLDPDEYLIEEDE